MKKYKNVFGPFLIFQKSSVKRNHVDLANFGITYLV